MMAGLAFYKMSGSGNDFVMLDGRLTRPEEWTPEEIRTVCRRGTGVGADGLVFVSPGSGVGAARMKYFNSDGSHAAMCGNAALCATRLAAHLGLAPAAGMRLETDAGTYESRFVEGADRAALRLAPVDRPQDVSGLALAAGERQAALGVVGVPHLVVVVDDVDRVDLARRGPALRADPALGPDGANVNFVSRAPDGGWRMRTYERGVEDETLACGTGAVTAGCALAAWGLGRLPMVIHTRSGLELKVRAKLNGGGRFDDVWLEGEARLVFKGVLA